MHVRRSRVNDTLGNPLVIKIRVFFAKDEILQERRASRIGPKRVFIIAKRDPLVRGKHWMLATDDLVQLACDGWL